MRRFSVLNMKIKLFPKFLIFITLISITPLMVIGFLTININKEMLQTKMLEYHTKITTALSEKIDDKIGNIEKRMNFVIATQRQEYLSPLEQIGIIRNILVASDDFVRASVIDRAGDEVIAANPKFEKSPPRPGKYIKNEFFVEVKKNQTYRATPLYYEQERPMIDFYFPLANKYVLKICVSLEDIADIVDDTGIGATGHIFIVDKNGKIIFHSKKELAVGSEDVSAEPIVKAALSSVNVGSQEFVSKGGIGIIGAFAPVKRLGWRVIFQQMKNEAYSSMIRMRKNAFVTILVALLLAVSVSYVLAGSLSKPILKVIDVSKSVARRDFTKKIIIETNDEMHDLANNFNDMIDELSRYAKMQADKLSAIVYSINDGLVLTEENNNIVLMNDIAAKVLSIPRDSTGMLFDVVSDGKLLSALKRVSEKPEIAKEVDLSGDRPFIISVSTQVIADPDKKTVEGIIFILRDITGEKEIEKMKDDFLHGITHDLRNPLTSMLGFLKFLIDGSVGPVNEKQKHFLGIINRSSNRLLGMINDILDVAKLEAGRMVLSLKQFDIKDTVKSACDGMASRAMEGKIELIDESPSVIISADEEMIERVLINLIGNALKYTSADGKVRVFARDFGEKIEVSVADTGEGIPPEYLDKIFDKFQQVGARDKGGTGIGLTITKYIIEAHLGKIWVESRVGEGSRFVFTIPRNLKKNEKDEICV